MRSLPHKANVKNAFRDTKLNFHRAYLDCDWGMRTVAFAGTGVPLSKLLYMVPLYLYNYRFTYMF